MFTQIDVLSLPGAGLRHLDFPQVASMFQGYFTGDDSTSHVHMGPIPSPLSTTQCLVRTYGSEPEMYAFPRSSSDPQLSNNDCQIECLL
jgi:hypothetical protein